MGGQFAEELLIVDLDLDAPARALPPLEREREMYDALVMALRDYMRKTGFTRAIVAVSGGIDSALALAIAVDALGADQRLGVQHAVAVQHRDDAHDCGGGLARARRRTMASSPFRTSPTTSSGCSKSTRTRSRAGSRARTCRRASEAS